MVHNLCVFEEIELLKEQDLWILNNKVFTAKETLFLTYYMNRTEYSCNWGMMINEIIVADIVLYAVCTIFWLGCSAHVNSIPCLEQQRYCRLSRSSICCSVHCFYAMLLQWRYMLWIYIFNRWSGYMNWEILLNVLELFCYFFIRHFPFSSMVWSQLGVLSWFRWPWFFYLVRLESTFDYLYWGAFEFSSQVDFLVQPSTWHFVIEHIWCVSLGYYLLRSNSLC